MPDGYSPVRMGVVLSVRESAWRTHLEATVAEYPGIVPVVKGNGYGFGRPALAETALDLLERSGSVISHPVPGALAVGTVHEVADIPAAATPHVLTPEMGPLPAGLRSDTVLTVGSIVHVEHLARLGWQGDVTVKLASSMHRYGCTPDELGHLERGLTAARLRAVAYAVHPPLAGDDEQRRHDVTTWLSALDPHLPVIASHLTPATWARLLDDHPDRPFAIRIGTRLWHGNRAALHLGATVNDVRHVSAGTAVGYRQLPVAERGSLVLIGAGTAHGVHPLADGASPFHFAQRRLALVEPPHMHTSMAFVPAGDRCPAAGDVVDVQRPLTQTIVDTVTWLP
jgi:alanine racemase